MSLFKSVEKLAKNHTVLFTVVAAVALMYVMKNYSNGKGFGGMQGLSNKTSEQYAPAPALSSTNGNCGQGTNYKPSAGLGQNESSAQVSGMNTNTHGLAPSCTRQQVVDPRQLLPKDDNNSFSKMNPGGAGDIQNVSLLKAGYHIGINSVGQSLRNANLQIRSEPANPQMNIGPWNQTTMGPDLSRRPLEVGCQGGR